MYCQTGNVHVQEVKVIAVKIFWPARLLRPWAHRIVLHCIAIASYYTIILRCLHNPFLSLCSLSPNTRSLYILLSHTLSLWLSLDCYFMIAAFLFLLFHFETSSRRFLFISLWFLVVSLIAASFIFVVFVSIRIPLTLRHTKWAMIAIIIIVIVDLNVMRAVFYIAFRKCHDCGRHIHFMFNAFVKQSIDSFQLICF